MSVSRTGLMALLLGFFILPFSLSALNHDLWDMLLKKNVSEKGQVDYQGFQNSKAELEKYLLHLQNNSPQKNWSRSEIMAYWINAYNAYTVKLVLSEMPLKSIMDIDNGKAWDRSFIPHKGEKISLNFIEHKILRANFKDARIHFAVNCASFSCPKLSRTAFTAENLETQLETLSRSFVNNPSKNKISSNSIQISLLFDWYKEDFTSSGTLIDFLNKYSSTKISQNATVSFVDYDWSLND